MSTRGADRSDLSVTTLAAVLRLLADETRLSILRILSHGERNVGSLGQELKLSQPTVSHHLGLLRSQSIVATRRAGKMVFYSLNGIVHANDGAISVRTVQFDIRIAPRTE